ncbi:hypothetical protein MRX96_001710 [Rhipicephalus microplus]
MLSALPLLVLETPKPSLLQQVGVLHLPPALPTVLTALVLGRQHSWALLVSHLSKTDLWSVVRCLAVVLFLLKTPMNRSMYSVTKTRGQAVHLIWKLLPVK